MAHFDLFVYGTLRSGGPAAEILSGCELVAGASVEGTLYDIDGAFPALVLAGTGSVPGEVWRCPTTLLPQLDEYEATATGLFRRVGLLVDGRPCWTYVAGPRLARKLTPSRRRAARG